MASTYPTSLDAFTNPTGLSLLTSPDHAQQHSDLNDAVEALEAKVAIGATVLGTYTSYTPTFAAGVTVGNGIGSGGYCRVNNFVHVHGTFTLGTTSAITGIVQPTLPININSAIISSVFPYGLSAYLDASTGISYQGSATSFGSGSSVALTAYNASSTYLFTGYPQATIPFTWTTSDMIQWNLYYRAA